jgi:hypothetical protein
LPVEVALVQRDEVVSLLAALGATIDAYVGPSYQPNMTPLQWTSAMLAKLRTPSVSSPTQDPLTGDTWGQYHAYLAAVLPAKEDGSVTAPQLHMLRTTVVPQLDEEHALETRDYYARAESILRSYSAVPMPQSVETPTVQTSGQQQHTLQGSKYFRHTKVSLVPIPAHLKVLYDELFEACWTGDNGVIQELCLPKHLAEGKEPIQISVQISVPVLTNNYFAHMTGMLVDIFSGGSVV